jgi:recombination protein RecT
MSTELTKYDSKKPAGSDLRGFNDYLQRIKPQLAQVAATHLNPDRILRMIAVNVSRTPALQKCSGASILRSIMQAAELGLEPGSATGEAYLVPYGDQCTLIPGYKGLIALAYRSGHVKSVTAKVVYQGDTFEYEEGLAPKLRHIPAFDGSRSNDKLTFAYCVVQLKEGGYLYDVMTRSEIDAIRKRSKASGSGPWVTDFAEMARKTVTRRCLKYAPMSVEMSKAMAMEEAHETGDPTALMAEFSDLGFDEPESVPEPTRTDKLKDRLGVDPDTAEKVPDRTVKDDDQQGLI